MKIKSVKGEKCKIEKLNGLKGNIDFNNDFIFLLYICLFIYLFIYIYCVELKKDEEEKHLI